MAHTGSFVKLLRQLSAAKDSYRSGAMDFEWAEGKATIYLVFGQPNHAVYDGEDGTHLEGQAALAELAMRLPSQFQISNWRKEVVRNETLDCSMEELIAPFALLAGTKSDDVPDRTSGGPNEDPLYAEIPQGPKIPLEEFPLLPVGPSMWADADAHVVHLDVLTPKLPPSLVVLTAPKLKAVAIVVHGTMIDALWVDEEDTFYGEAAGMAMIGASKGSLSGYKMPDEATAEAISLLWRTPVSHAMLDSTWLRPETMLAGIERSMRNTVISITTKTDRCVGIITMGQLVGTWSGKDRTITTSRESLLEYLSQPGTVTIMQGAAVKAAGPKVDAMVHQYVEDTSTAAAAEATKSTAGKASAASSSKKKTSARGTAAKSVAPDIDYLAEASGAAPAPSAPAEPPAAWLSGPASPAGPPPATAPPVLETELETGAEPGTVSLPEPAGGESSHTTAQAEGVADATSVDAGMADTTGVASPPPDADSATALGTESNAGGTVQGAAAESAGDYMAGAGDGPSLETGDISGATATPEEVPEEAGNGPLPHPGEAIWLAKAAEPDPANLAAAQSWNESDGALDILEATGPVEPAQQTVAPAEDATTAGSVQEATDAGEEGSPPIYVDFGSASELASSTGAEDEAPDGASEDEGNPDIDTQAIKADLIQIGVRWLGQDSAGEIIAMIEATGSDVDDFVGTIDRIRNATVPGYDPSVIRSMAREMHYYAAEALCGA